MVVGGFGLAAQFVGCGGGGDDGGSAGDASTGPQCTVDLECEDENPCTLDTCGEGKTCEHESAPNGDAKDQVEGDCSRTVCTNGIPSEVPDTGDILDDDEYCTLDTCEPGGPSHVTRLDNTPCTVGTGKGTCQTGKCTVLCTPSTALTQCNDENPCTDDACIPCTESYCQDKGKCVHQGLSGMQTPGAPQETGDCHERRCVEGKDEDAIDNFDIPEDGNDCTDDICKDGIPVNQPLTAGTACPDNASYVCDGNGQCVECVSAADCTDPGSVCYTAACNNGFCSTDYAPAGTVVPDPDQQAGDCATLVCNGSGSATKQANPLDLPNDNNPCTDDVCNGTSPSHPYKPAGTSCGSSGQICSSSGNCCAPTTCAAKGLSCGTTSDGCGATLDCGTCSSGDACSGGKCGCANSVKSGTETDVDCGGICPTKCSTGLKCLAGSDCVSGNCVDGVCCNSACTGTCQACVSTKTGATTGTCANVTTGTDPDNECPTTSAATCGTTGMCGNGACQYHPAGTQCTTATCSASTEYPADTCNGSGTCVDNGSITCGAGYICSGGKCQTCSDGLKNGTETDIDCGGGGSCAKCTNGKKCTVANDCSSNQCVDGYCCNTTCTGTCMACNLVGNYGTCSPIPINQDPLDECPGQKTCNGSGGCT